jgi:hypothetical protein
MRKRKNANATKSPSDRRIDARFKQNSYERLADLSPTNPVTMLCIDPAETLAEKSLIAPSTMRVAMERASE